MRGKMAEKSFPFQPGVMLHEAIVGAFRATGGSFEVWCAENGVEQLPPPTLDTAGLDFIRAVPSERSFSREELLTLTDEGLAGAITITPGGSVFAVHLRGSPADSLGGLLDQFEVRLASDPVQLALAKLPADERRKVVEHVRLLWLERHERLDYFWDVTGRQNDLFSSLAGLFDTLLVDPPQKSP